MWQLTSGALGRVSRNVPKAVKCEEQEVDSLKTWWIRLIAIIIYNVLDLDILYVLCLLCHIMTTSTLLSSVSKQEI